MRLRRVPRSVFDRGARQRSTCRSRLFGSTTAGRRAPRGTCSITARWTPDGSVRQRTRLSTGSSTSPIEPGGRSSTASNATQVRAGRIVSSDPVRARDLQRRQPRDPGRQQQCPKQRNLARRDRRSLSTSTRRRRYNSQIGKRRRLTWGRPCGSRRTRAPRRTEPRNGQATSRVPPSAIYEPVDLPRGRALADSGQSSSMAEVARTSIPGQSRRAQLVGLWAVSGSLETKGLRLEYCCESPSLRRSGNYPYSPGTAQNVRRSPSAARPREAEHR